MKPPTEPEVFIERTALLIDVLVGRALEATEHPLTPAQVEWFIAHCDKRFRWFHANKPDWRKWLENRDRRIDPRDQCLVWVRHWLAAYVLNPGRFEAQDKAVSYGVAK